jgi:hypothetical protein
VVDVVLHQCSLGLIQCLFHGMKLLRQLKTGALLFNHLNNTAQMPLSTFETLDDGRVS